MIRHSEPNKNTTSQGQTFRKLGYAKPFGVALVALMSIRIFINSYRPKKLFPIWK